MADNSHSGTPDRRAGGNSLPEGWGSACYGDVYLSASNGTGGSQNKDGVGIPVSRIETIANEKIDYDRIGYLASFDEVKVQKHKLLLGDILFSHINSPVHLGKTAIYDGENTLYHGINLLRIIVNRDVILPEIFNWHCKYTRGQGEFSLRAQHAVNQSSLNQKKLSEFEIPLPPLAEQKVIAEKLDTLLAQVDTTKARLERIPDIIKRFRQSVLAAAVSGKLTEEWRGNNLVTESAKDLLDRWLSERLTDFQLNESELLKNGKIKKTRKFKEPSLPDIDTSGVIDIPEQWLCVSVSQFAECLDSQRIPVKKDARVSSAGLYPYFGANGEVDRVDDFIFDDDLVLVTEDETFYGREKPIAYRYTGKCWVNNHAHVLRARTKEANDYLCYALMHYKVIPWLSGTTGRAKLTQAALNILPIGLPPLVELAEIVRRVEELFAFADTIEQKAAAALERVSNLTQSILAKAFRGELTADWRAANPELISGDNSAEALLAKIQAEREALKPVKKTRKKKA